MRVTTTCNLGKERIKDSGHKFTGIVIFQRVELEMNLIKEKLKI